LKSKTSSRIIRQVCPGKFSDGSRLFLLYDGRFGQLQPALLSRKLLSSASIPQDDDAHFKRHGDIVGISDKSLVLTETWRVIRKPREPSSGHALIPCAHIRCAYMTASECSDRGIDASVAMKATDEIGLTTPYGIGSRHWSK